MSHIKDLVEQKADAIAVSALTLDALCDTLKQAMAQGVKVVTYDSDTKPDAPLRLRLPASAEDIAVRQLKLLGGQIGYQGDIASCPPPRRADNQDAWISSIKRSWRSRGTRRCEQDVVHGDDEADKSYRMAERLLRDHGKLKGIISLPQRIKAGPRSTSQSRYKGEVKLTGLGALNDMRPTSRTAPWRRSCCGTRPSSASWPVTPRWPSPPGRSPSREGQMFLAGDMGWFQLTGNGVVTLGDLDGASTPGTSTTTTSTTSARTASGRVTPASPSATDGRLRGAPGQALAGVSPGGSRAAGAARVQVLQRLDQQ